MRTATSCLVTLLAVAAPVLAQDAAAPAKPKWKQLFNGKDLTGWRPKITGYQLGENFGNTFRVEDGVLEVRYDQYDKFDGRFGHLFYDGEFSNYILRVEYRFVGEQCPGGPGWAFRNSGIMIHGQPPETMGRMQKFPVSIEVQLLGGRAEGKRTTSNLCTPGTNVVMHGHLVKRHCTNSTSETYRGDRWVTAVVEVQGNHIKHILDGKTVLEYTDPQLDPTDGDAKKLLAIGRPKMLHSGSISLQSESHPVEFRKIEILELPDATWTDLLPNNDLSQHWQTKGNWQVDDAGVITLTPRKGERGWRRFGSYLWSKQTYTDFEIEFEYRVPPRGNSGFYFHVGDLGSPVEKGIEVQIFDSHDKAKGAKLTDHDSGGIIPSIPPKVNAAKPTSEWNKFHIVCKGNKLVVELNGEVVNEVSLAQPKLAGRPKSGYIGFQDHGMAFAVRNIRIR